MAPRDLKESTKMVDKKHDMQALSFQWGVIGGHAAVAVGAFAALASLLRGVSLSTACLRGIVCVLVLRTVFYFIRTLLELFGRSVDRSQEADSTGP